VTILNPSWSSARPLLRAIRKAAADGAEHVLLLTHNSENGSKIAVTGSKSVLSLSDIRSVHFDHVLNQQPPIDLCVMDLDVADLERFAEFVEAVKPHLRPGGKIVGFHMYTKQALCDFNPPNITCEVAFGGSDKFNRMTTQLAVVLNSLTGAAIGPSILTLLRLSLFSAHALIQNVLRLVVGATAGAGEARDGTLMQTTRSYSSVAITVRVPHWFQDDSGTFDYAVASGVHLGAAEAPVTQENSVDKKTANPPRTTVILTMGQSNAANDGGGHYVPRHRVHSFNMFDMNYYKAVDPLPGATNSRGSIWGRLGDKLIESGRFESILFVPLAVGGTFIKEWTPADGECYRRLQFALARVKRADLRIHMICWHHGEADANHAMTSAEQYKRGFLRMVKQIRIAGVHAPIFIAVSSVCENGVHPYHNHRQVRLAQQQLVSDPDNLFPGPDTDQFIGEFREDGCHFSAKGLDAVANAWLDSILRYWKPTKRPLLLRFSGSNISQP
jgi:hypothetical protein